jgi:hypothetical protein
MNAKELIAAIRHVWLFIVPPILNLVFLGAVIEGTFGDGVSSLLDRVRAFLSGYLSQAQKLVNDVLSLVLTDFDAKSVGPWLSTAGSAGRGIFFVFLIVVFVVALAVEYVTRHCAKGGRSAGKLFKIWLKASDPNGSLNTRSDDINEQTGGHDWMHPPDKILCRPSFAFARRQFTNPLDQQGFSPVELHRVVLAWLAQNAKDGSDLFANRREAAESANFLGKMEDYFLFYLMICIAYVFCCLVFGGMQKLSVYTLGGVVVILAIMHRFGVRERWAEIILDFDAYYYLKIACSEPTGSQSE